MLTLLYIYLIIGVIFAIGGMIEYHEAMKTKLSFGNIFVTLLSIIVCTPVWPYVIYHDLKVMKKYRKELEEFA